MSLNPGDDHLSESDKEALAQAWDTFGAKNAFDIADNISHKYPEWNRYEKLFSAGDRSSKQVNLTDFFDNPVDNDEFFYADDGVLRTSREKYLENQRIQEELRGSFV